MTIEVARVPETVRPFARILSGMNTVLPPQDRFDDLAELFDAYEHADLALPPGYIPYERDQDIGHFANLPFRLALGIHPAVRHAASSEVLRATYDEYAAVKSVAQLYPGGPKAECRYQADRARAVMIGAILTAAAADNAMGGNPAEALKRIYDEGYIGRRAYRRTDEVLGYARIGV